MSMVMNTEEDKVANKIDFYNNLLSDVVSLNYEEADNTIKGINNYLIRYKDLTIMDKMSVLRASVYRNQKEKGRVR